MAKKEHRYRGKGVEVRWDAIRCIHAAECLRRLPEVFDVRRQPWILPDAATADAVTETILHCPTGALHVTRADGVEEKPPEVNHVQVRPHNALYVHGDVEIVTPEGERVLKDTRVALCRCGQSHNKPYCDNGHLESGFQDLGRLGTPRGQVVETAGGPIKITPRTNGPLAIEGRVEVSGTDGTRVRLENAVLCRCGASGNKPYCDGSHKAINFSSAD